MQVVIRAVGYAVICFGISLSTQSEGALVKAETVVLEAKKGEWPGTQSIWQGFERFDFEVDGRPAYVVVPKHKAPGNPWVFRARFPGFHAEADLILLNRGFHVARINTDGMLGSPNAMGHWDKFYLFLTKRGLAKRCALEGVSRGGLFVYGFAHLWPERVSCIYCDTPVCDLSSWPGGKGIGRGHEPTWKACLREYGLTEEAVGQFKEMPIYRLSKIAEAKIPILHIISMNDEIVPPAENTLVLAERYRKLGGSIEIMRVQNGSKKSGGHHFNHPDPMRVADFIELHASTQVSSEHLTQKERFPSGDYFVLRGSLDNCRIKFETTRKGRVAFMGGSITVMKGWRNIIKEYLIKKFPDTVFEFVDAGISSTGSVPGAFRLTRDVFGKGAVDLLFEEAAVNDLHNGRSASEMVRGMEGIVRQTRRKNPNLDIVVMHFVDPNHMNDYRNKLVPQVIMQHESVASHYDVPTIHLAKEVTERINAGQFDWKNDFKNLHPSPYGHRLYASTIRRMLTAAWAKPLIKNKVAVAHRMPEKRLDKFCFDGAKIERLQNARLDGFELIKKCDPRAEGIGGGVRGGFYDVPMLVGKDLNDKCSFSFLGRAVGVCVAAGPDAGQIEYSIDGGPWKSQELFTKWSGRLHIPWFYVLESELSQQQHTIRIRVAAAKHSRSKGNAVRIVNLLVNE